MIRSLFVIHCESNTGYAITSIERLFIKTGLSLADGDLSSVHFCFPDTSKGLSDAFPEGFAGVLQCDIHNLAEGSLEQITGYVKEHQIQLVVFFDIQPIHPSFRALRKAGASTIIAYWGASIASLQPLWKRSIKRLLIALSRSKVDSLVFESEIMAYHATQGRGVPRSMIDVVPLGVDVVKYRPGGTSYIHDTFDFPRESRVFVYSGHMEERKGVRVIVEAAIELLTRRNRRDVGFLICGNADNESAPFEKMYEGLGLERHIQFGGYRDDLPKILPSAYGGVIASTGWDSFTYSSIEMAASGLPILASRLQGLTEAVADKKTGLLFDPGNAQMLTDYVELLLDKPELAAEYGKQGRLRCENELTYEHQEKAFLSLVRKRIGLSQDR